MITSRTFLYLLAALCVTPSCSDATPGAASGASTPSVAVADALVDVREEAGVDFVHTHGARGDRYLFETMGSGVAATDFDSDGRVDLLFLQSGTLPREEFRERQWKKARHRTRTTAKLFLNTGGDAGTADAWSFRDATGGSGLDVPFYAMGLAVGDVDGDGDRDVYVAAYGRDRFFRNEGGGRFTDATEEVGIQDDRWMIGGAFLDVDLDGDLDLYALGFIDMPLQEHRVCGASIDLQYYCHVDGWEGIPDRLWINDGSGRFHDGTEAAGLAHLKGRGLAVVGSDWDDDGDTDLFVANDSMANHVLRNDGGGRFTEIGGMSGADLNANGRSEACMGSDMGDLDDDGDPDLFVANFEDETNTLYRNDGGGFFTDVSGASNAGPPSLGLLGFGTTFFDLENDGDLDIYIANGHIMDNVEQLGDGTGRYAQPDQLLLNDGRGRFSQADPGLSVSLREPRVGRGLARADIDGDGDADLVVSNSDQRPWVLRNDRATGHRIVLELEGPDGRADCEGAKVVVHAGDRRWVREIVSGGSYESHSDSALVIGLGDAARVDRIEIRWPGGSTSELGPVEADRRLRVAFGGELLDSAALDP